MKLIDVDSKATLEDFLTLKKRLNLYSFYGNAMKKSAFFYRSLKKGNVVYIIFFIKVKASNELSIAAYVFIVI
jgi:hypothetical protein